MGVFNRAARRGAESNDDETTGDLPQQLRRRLQRRMVIAGHDVPTASLPYTLTSDAGHLMAQGEPFAACYWDTDEHRCFSLRATDDGMDVSEIAAQYGGGGHAKAAGFKVPRSHALATA